VAWRQSAQAQYLLGFNEPAHSDQANMSVAWAISLWPQLQANGGEGKERQPQFRSSFRAVRVFRG
jgi:hypothetical protein